jgi:hypothetical protein
MKRTLFLSVAASALLFADSDIEELKQLVREQQAMIQALQSRVETLEKHQNNATEETTQATPVHVAQESEPPAKTETVETKVKPVTIAQAPKKKLKAKRSAPPPPPEPSVEELTQADIDEVETAMAQEESPTVAGSDRSAMLPGIALIGNMSALERDISNELYGHYSIPGFVDEAEELPFNPERGFNLNYAELEIFSTIGPYLDMDSAFHISQEGLEIGELFVTTRTLPYSLRLKAGKFKSDFGRINSKHQHAWSFSSFPLVFEGFFGHEGLSDEGVQLQWVAPTDLYLMAGAEAMSGNNEVSFGDADGIRLFTGYLKSSFDLSDTTTMLAGVSYMQGKNEFGDTKIYGGDLTLKSSFDSYSGIRWQTELLYREKAMEDGTTGDQAGLYSELIYDYNQNWSAGIRYDTLYKNLYDTPEPLDRYTAMVLYKPFEFSKLRLQYTYDQSKYFEGEQQDIHEILLDLTFEVGAHGAHAF